MLISREVHRSLIILGLVVAATILPPPLVGQSPNEEAGSLEWVCTIATGDLSAAEAAIARIEDYSPVGGLRNPFSSTIPHGYPMPQLLGVNAAYAIELRLSQTYRDKPDCIAAHRDLPTHQPRRTYTHVAIVTVDNRPIRAKDLRKIQIYYSKWWKAHHGLSLKELQKCWSTGDRPLKGARYKWI